MALLGDSQCSMLSLNQIDPPSKVAWNTVTHTLETVFYADDPISSLNPTPFPNISLTFASVSSFLIHFFFKFISSEGVLFGHWKMKLYSSLVNVGTISTSTLPTIFTGHQDHDSASLRGGI